MDSGLLLKFQEDVASFSVFTANRTQSPQLKKTLYKAQHKRKPEITTQKVFGSIAYVYIPKERSDYHKLLSKAQKGIFLRYGRSRYRVQDLINKKLVISNYTVIKENEFGSNYLKELRIKERLRKENPDVPVKEEDNLLILVGDTIIIDNSREPSLIPSFYPLIQGEDKLDKSVDTEPDTRPDAGPPGRGRNTSKKGKSNA